MINYGQHTIDQDDVDAVVAVLKGDLITQGPVVEQFETALAERVGAKFAIVVSSGTAALHLACLAANLNSNSFGLTSALTFVASANAMMYCGSKVGLCDIDPSSLNISPTSLEASLKKHPNTEVIVPVHFAGLPAHSDVIREIAGNRIIIEDAAHAFGANYSCGRPVGCGAYADMTVFSFHPVKPITTGEGGAIVTNNSDLAHHLKTLRTHGIEREVELLNNIDASIESGQQSPWYYEQQHLGFNYRMTDIHAALGLSQLKKLDRFLNRRRSIAHQYNFAFSNIPTILRPQSITEYTNRSGHHLYILQFDLDKMGKSRTDIINLLRDQNIGSQVHYIPVYRHPYHSKKMELTVDQFPMTEEYYKNCLSIPFFPGMTDQNISHIIQTIIRISTDAS
jgi:perosamine synthetase